MLADNDHNSAHHSVWLLYLSGLALLAPALPWQVRPRPWIFLLPAPLLACFHPSCSLFFLIKLAMPHLFCSLLLPRALFLITINVGDKTKPNLSPAHIVCKGAVLSEACLWPGSFSTSSGVKQYSVLMKLLPTKTTFWVYLYTVFFIIWGLQHVYCSSVPCSFQHQDPHAPHEGAWHSVDGRWGHGLFVTSETILDLWERVHCE